MKRDIISAFRSNRKGILLGFSVLLCGVVLGIYIGVNVGKKEAPFGVFAALFHLQFSPFSYLVPDFLRFFLFGVLTLLSFFLPLPFVYPAIALFFFGKYFGEISCVCFLSDTVIAAVLSIAVVYLPLLLVGGGLLLLIALRAREFRLPSGADLCPKNVMKEVFFLLKLLLAYFVCLFLLYVIICGTLYLLVIAL